MKHAIVLVLVAMSTTSAESPKDTSKVKDDEARAQVEKIQHELVDSISKGPKAAATYFEPLLADDVVITDHDAKVYDKARFLQMAKEGNQGPLAMEWKDAKTQAYGDTVVVTGLLAAKDQLKGFRFTKVYIKRQKQWQIVAMQFTSINR